MPGWFADRPPPSVLIGNGPPRAIRPSCTKAPPSPFLQNPRPSKSRSTVIVNDQNKSPEFINDTPYNVALVQLEEGPRMLSSIVEIAPAELHVDLPVSVVFEKVTDRISLPRFRPRR